MRLTLPLDFNTVLSREQTRFMDAACSRFDAAYTTWHPASGLQCSGATAAETVDELLSISGFTELELGLPTNYGHGRWTYAQHAMAHALTKAGWSRARTAAALGKTRNAVTGLLYRDTPWRTVADTRAGGWSKEDTATVVRLRDVEKKKWRDVADVLMWSESHCRNHYREAKNPKPEEPHCARV